MKPVIKLLLIGTFAVVPFTHHAMAATNLINNGAFNTDDSQFMNYDAGYASSAGIPDWTTVHINTGLGVNGPDTKVSTNVFGPADPTTDNDGNTVRDFAFEQNQSGSTNGGITAISQNFSVVKGDTYTLTFDVGVREYTEAAVAYVTFGDSAGDAATPFDVAVTYGHNDTTFPLQFQYETLTFMATANSTGTVELENRGTDADDAADYANIDVTASGGSVPEPSTWAYLAAGLGAFAFFLRWHKRRA